MTRRIRVNGSQFKFLVPGLGSGRTLAYSIDRNNEGQHETLRRAHHELKHLLDLAVETANKEDVPLEEIEIICPQLMGLPNWAGYFGTPWDNECNANQLEKWFEDKHGEFRFYVNARYDYERDHVLIDFSTKKVQKHASSFSA